MYQTRFKKSQLTHAKISFIIVLEGTHRSDDTPIARSTQLVPRKLSSFQHLKTKISINFYIKDEDTTLRG